MGEAIRAGLCLFVALGMLACAAPASDLCEGAADGTAVKARAVVVGVNYAGTDWKLSYAAADAIDFEHALTDEEEIPSALLTDTGSPGTRPATKGEILGALKKASEEIQKDEMLVFFFSGHGFRRGAESYLCPQDMVTARDEAGRLAADVGSCISMSELREILQARRCRLAVLFLDACRNDGPAETSARGLPFPAFTLPESEPFAKNIGSVPRASHPIVAYCAASAGQVAREKPDYENGVFTEHLINALMGAATECPQEVLRLDGLVKYVTERCLGEPSPFAQSPTWRMLDGEQPNFDFTGVPVAFYECAEPQPERQAILVPDVTGRRPDEAEAMLKALGLTIGDVQIRHTADRTRDGLVLDQEPGPQARLVRAARVSLVVGRYREVVRAPSTGSVGIELTFDRGNHHLGRSFGVSIDGVEQPDRGYLCKARSTESTRVYTFRATGIAPGRHQVEVTLGTCEGQCRWGCDGPYSGTRTFTGVTVATGRETPIPFRWADTTLFLGVSNDAALEPFRGPDGRELGPGGPVAMCE